MHDTPVLLVAAHGTRSAAGVATTTSLVEAIRSARPSVDVRLCFLDVLQPSLAEALDSLASTPAVVVPLLLSAGYHVQTDIPAVVAGRPSVRVADHLGPDPLLVDALVDRLALARVSAETASARVGEVASTVLVGIGSSRAQARADVRAIADALAERLGRAVTVLTPGAELASALRSLPAPVEVVPYLLAPGEFVDTVRAAAAGIATVAEPIGVHPALVSLVLARYDAAR